MTPDPKTSYEALIEAIDTFEKAIYIAIENDELLTETRAYMREIRTLPAEIREVMREYDLEPLGD